MGHHQLSPNYKTLNKKSKLDSKLKCFRHPRKDKSSINSQALRRPLRMFEKQAFGFIRSDYRKLNLNGRNENRTYYKKRETAHTDFEVYGGLKRIEK
uniref:Uncharacterized protein n=3 Tax=Noccaea caerulescens TaxID=107243 RepID=A0A1J3DI12_NOCCA